MSTSSPDLSPPEADATASSYLTPARFHRSLTLPASTTIGTTSHPELRVTFAVCGAGVDDLIIKNDPTGGFKSKEKQVPTILYCGGLFGSRYHGIFGCDFMAKAMGVRIVFVDRYVLYYLLVVTTVFDLEMCVRDKNWFSGKETVFESNCFGSLANTTGFTLKTWIRRFNTG